MVNVVIKYVKHISVLCLFIEHINMCLVINGACHDLKKKYRHVLSYNQDAELTFP